MKNDIVLIGGGGHCKVVIDAIRCSGLYKIVGIVDPNIKHGKKLMGVSVIGGDGCLGRIRRSGVRNAFVAVGSIGDCSTRVKLYERVKDIGFDTPLIIHPKSCIAKNVHIGKGTFVAAGATINSATKIGENAIINTSSSIDHDCKVGDFVHIAPGAVLCGTVKIGDRSHIGAGATVIQQISIGKDCIVGAGCCVRKEMQDKSLFIGDRHQARRYLNSTKGKVFIIAEAGVNHNGNIEIAKRLIDAAKASGADAVKFQTFKAEEMVSKSAERAEYQKAECPSYRTQYEMIKTFELGKNEHRQLINYAKTKGITFLSSPFDIDSIKMLDSLGIEIFKIPSGEINNLPYLRRVGELKKKVILSTGMSNLAEIKNAVDILIKAGTVKEEITVLHCNTEYPTPVKDVNLLAMVTIGDYLGVRIGYSDHTLSIQTPVAAVALGAAVIEKHLTLGRNMKGPDHRASLEPDEFKSMVSAIRDTERMLGSGIKNPSASELKNMKVVRKSIVSLVPIRKGDIFTEKNITTKRPGGGINPMEWDIVLGKKAKRNFKQDEMIEL